MTIDNRGASSVISVILMVAVVAILAATVSVFVFDFGERINQPAPNVADTTGEFVIDDPDPDNNQLVRITHLGGDSVAVEKIEVVIRVSGPDVDTEARLINLPAERSDLDQVNIEGDASIIDKSFGKSGPSHPNQVIVEDFPTDNNIWNAGETIQFRVNTGAADFSKPPSYDNADKLKIIIIHTPSNAIISEHIFTP